MTDSTYKYIIIGAGSAGCVLANRLSEDPENSVLLLEAGSSDGSIFIDMPTALSYPMASKKYNWGYNSDPETHLDGRVITCPRGKGLGGTSSINGMVYVRGHAMDYAEWEELGAMGWGYQDCLPYFKKAETWQGGEDEYRGGNGPLGVTGGNNMKLNPLYETFIKAGVEAGYPETADYNAAQQEGFGAMHMTVSGGVRESTARAYLRPVMKRKNLTVITDAMVQKIVFDGKRASGIDYIRNGKLQTVHASSEIILAAGAIGSPATLQLSGVGPAAVLKEAGVEQLHDLPGVGENLQDHMEVYFQYECKQPITLNNKLSLISKAIIGTRWFFFKSGLGATNHFESCAFIRSDKDKKWPDIQYHFIPAAITYDSKAAFDGHGFQVHIGPNKPKSRGRVAIKSSNANDAPSILFNYFEKQDDVKAWRACIRLTREIIEQPAMDEYRGEEIQPGKDIQTDSQIDDWVRDNCESAYHPAGTCKIGRDDDPMAVVDTQCRVRGLAGLRVVDASVFPTVPNGNLNGPTIMVAEKAADMILGKAPLPHANVPVWKDAAWEKNHHNRTPKRIISSD